MAFLVKELVAVLDMEMQEIKVLEGSGKDPVPMDDTSKIHFTREAQTVHNVLFDVIREKELGTSTVDAKRICLLLDPM